MGHWYVNLKAENGHKRNRTNFKNMTDGVANCSGFTETIPKLATVIPCSDSAQKDLEYLFMGFNCCQLNISHLEVYQKSAYSVKTAKILRGSTQAPWQKERRAPKSPTARLKALRGAQAPPTPRSAAWPTWTSQIGQTVSWQLQWQIRKSDVFQNSYRFSSIPITSNNYADGRNYTVSS